MTIQTFFKRNRKKLGLNNTELARQLGIKAVTLKGIMSGEISCSLETFLKMLEISGYAIIEKDTVTELKSKVRAATRQINTNTMKAPDVVRTERKKKGLTQNQLSERAGTGIHLVNRFENKENIKSSSLLKILKELNIFLCNHDTVRNVERNIANDLKQITFLKLEI